MTDIGKISHFGKQAGQLRMDSVSIRFILEWAILPLSLLVVWMIRKVFFLDRQLSVLEGECKTRISMEETSRSELMDAINSHNSNIMTRLTSIEEHLRNGKR